MLLALLIVDLLFDPGGSGRFAVPYFAAALPLLAGLNSLLRTTYFTYDPESELIETRTVFDWIAYSTNPLQIREVAPGGASRPIPVSHLIADPEDLADFIAGIDNLSAPEEPDTVEGHQ
jgi:hypothetical protein